MKTLKDLSNLLEIKEFSEIMKLLIKLKEVHNYKVFANIDNEVYIDEEFYTTCKKIIERHNQLIIPQKDIIENSKDSVLIEDGHYVYFLLFNDKLVYIGESNALLNRIHTHKKDKLFNKIYCLKPEDACLSEILNIRYHQPEYNSVIYSPEMYAYKVFKQVISLIS